ncbi:MAG TPA: YebC/PmpR family DNA-binding transcriptional regulator [Candidatus Acidoferrum sp.]|nr:YebC/PmpR family DNA-binding transcriptional regulator [Candidatus Acidoferrum sp.]
MGRAYQNRKESMAKTSANKSKVYGKYGREIYVVAKTGGVDPNGNLALRSIIERAKRDQVPAHVIEKAIDKAKGGGGEDYSITRYEGFGPGSCMLIVECLTDNPNRTFGDVRVCFNKTNSKLGTVGVVSHMFDHSLILVFKGDEEKVMEALLNADVNVSDIESEGGKITVFAPHTEYAKAKAALAAEFGNIDYEVDEIQFIPQTYTAISGEDVATFEKFMDLLNDLDDVQKVYHNAEY